MRKFLLKCSRSILGWPPSPASYLHKQALIKRKAREHQLEIFVETGTFRGEMIDAQSEHFRKLISIELSPELFQAAVAKYANNPRVKLIQGDSGTKLQEAVLGLDEPALFWLDAHYSQGVTAGASEAAPILKELSCLAGRHRHKDVILIDDARLFGLKAGYPGLKVIRQFVSTHWPQRALSVDNDVICILP